MDSKFGSLYFFYLYLNITKVKWNPSLDHFTYLRKSFWASNTKSSSSHSSRYASGRTFLLTKTAWYIFFLHSSSLGSPHAAATQSMYSNCKIAIKIHKLHSFNREVLDITPLIIRIQKPSLAYLIINSIYLIITNFMSISHRRPISFERQVKGFNILHHLLMWWESNPTR